MNQIEAAKSGKITEEMAFVANEEKVDKEVIRDLVAKGRIAINKNKKRDACKPLGVGEGLRTKINANIGSSGDVLNMEEELKKAYVAIEAGADTIMDLSTGGDISTIRHKIIESVSVPIGTVPVYQAAVTARQRQKSIADLTKDDFLNSVEMHAKDGVDFVTVHCGVTRNSVKRLHNEGRLMNIVSRGGALTVKWMEHNESENPLYERYDQLLEIAHEYDLVLSLGDGMRPGSIADATDRCQIQELITLGELTERAWKAGVQVMIEGPGHVPLEQIEANILLEKQLCHGAPFYVLGPLVTDIAPGYDHITAAIGGAIAARAGADFLCYVTPSEHLRLPDIDDVREGVIASRIAAHAADISKKIPGAIEKDIKMSKFRRSMNWEGQIEMAIDKKRATMLRESSTPSDSDVCTMCGEFCAIKISKEEKK